MSHAMQIKRPVLLLLLSALVALTGGIASAAERSVYLVPDAQGSAVASMDARGDILWRESYAPYGERRTRVPANPGNPAYTGKPEDRDTGLVYMGARWYDAESARFTGNDPRGFSAGNPQSFGRYVYANNAPYVYVDPNGEVPLLIPVVVFVAKEGAGIAFEATTGLPAIFSVKGLAKAVADAGPAMAARAARRGVTGSATAGAKSTSDTTTLYRAVSKAELDDIAENGIRTTAGGYETGKLFASNMEDAARFGKNNFKLDGIPNHLIKVDVPSSVMKDATRFRADSMEAISIPANKLSQLGATPINQSPLVK